MLALAFKSKNLAFFSKNAVYDNAIFKMTTLSQTFFKGLKI